MEFKNIKELLDFVLIKCGGMDYRYHIDDDNHFFVKHSDWTPTSITLSVMSGAFDMQRIYFAFKMLQEKGVQVKSLCIIYHDIDSIPEGYLECMYGLKELNLSDNNLTELPKLPEGLVELNISRNRFVKLPELPKSIRRLYCRSNNIDELPKLHDNILFLKCEENNIKKTHNVPKMLWRLECDNKMYKLRFYLKKIYERLFRIVYDNVIEDDLTYSELNDILRKRLLRESGSQNIRLKKHKSEYIKLKVGSYTIIKNRDKYTITYPLKTWE